MKSHHDAYLIGAELHHNEHKISTLKCMFDVHHFAVVKPFVDLNLGTHLALGLRLKDRLFVHHLASIGYARMLFFDQVATRKTTLHTQTEEMDNSDRVRLDDVSPLPCHTPILTYPHSSAKLKREREREAHTHTHTHTHTHPSTLSHSFLQSTEEERVLSQGTSPTKGEHAHTHTRKHSSERENGEWRRHQPCRFARRG
jgi:hypothetical protein